METQKIWNEYSDIVYFFILKSVKNKDVANDVFQNTFLKIHKNLSQVRDIEKTKAWVLQIARNEVVNYFNKESTYAEKIQEQEVHLNEKYDHICCLDRFVDDLPEHYKEVIEQIYIQGKKQKEVAEDLGISLENVKARVRRAKEELKQKFNTCCKYELDENGKLVGESNCAACH